MTSEEPSLTIAIPTYNRAHKVRELAMSILKQMHSDDELLVVDDGSSDDTTKLLGAIPGVRVHTHSPNQGMVKTWNACLQLASNDWICTIHDDDELCDGGLQAIRSACLVVNDPALIIHAPISKNTNDQLLYKIFSPGPSAVACSATGTVPTGAVVHREIVRDLGGFDEELAYSADIEYFARINTKYKLLVIEAPGIVNYQLHDNNYQYKTWLKPDFYSQLTEIEKRVASYAGLKGAEAARRVNDTMFGYLTYIVQRSDQLKNRTLMRKYGLVLWQSYQYGKRSRLRGFITFLKSWSPL